MNENDRAWNVWAERCASGCQDKSHGPQDQPKCLDPSITNLRERPANTTSKDSGKCLSEEFDFSRSDRMDNCTVDRDSRFQEPDHSTIANRKLGSLLPEHDEICSRTETVLPLKVEMRTAEFLRMINSCGFGEVLTERNLRRQRRAFEGVDAGRGRINVVKYFAALCSRRRRKRSTGDLSVHDLETMLKTQNFRCALSGERLTPDDVALDHIVPISEGGTFDVDNSQLVTRAANRAKHTMFQQDFLDLCQRVTKHCGHQ